MDPPFSPGWDSRLSSTGHPYGITWRPVESAIDYLCAPVLSGLLNSGHPAASRLIVSASCGSSAAGGPVPFLCWGHLHAAPFTATRGGSRCQASPHPPEHPHKPTPYRSPLTGTPPVKPNASRTGRRGQHHPQPPPHTPEHRPNTPEHPENRPEPPPTPLTRELTQAQHAKTPAWDVRHHP